MDVPIQGYNLQKQQKRAKEEISDFWQQKKTAVTNHYDLLFVGGESEREVARNIKRWIAAEHCKQQPDVIGNLPT